MAAVRKKGSAASAGSITVRGVLHTSIPSPSAEHVLRSIPFYRDLLGLALLAVIDEPGNVKMAFLKALDGHVIIVTNGKGARRPTPGDENGPHTAFTVAAKDFDAAIVTMEAHGVEFFEKHNRQTGVLKGWRAYCRDPNGYTVEIIAPE